MYQIKKMRADHVIDFAAEELKKYLRMMMPECGDIAISYEPNATQGFRLGLAEDFGLNFEEVEDPVLDDVVHIETDEKGGILAGSNTRSVLFAVYRYLKENGCRWLYPGIDGEYIPVQDIKPISYHHLPSHRLRAQCNEGAESQQCMMETIDFTAKLEMNGYMIEFDTPYFYYDCYYGHRWNEKNRLPESVTPEQVKQWKRMCEVEIAKRGLQFHDMGHGWTADPYGLSSDDQWTVHDSEVDESIREHVALFRGKRQLFCGVALNTQVCMSNPKTRSIMVEAVVDYAKKHENATYVHVWLADGNRNHCECEECQKLRPSDYYLMIMHELDRRLTECGLDTRIMFIVYLDTLFAPLQEKIDNTKRFSLLYAPIQRSYSSSVKRELIGKPAEYERNVWKTPVTAEANAAFLLDWQENIWKGPCFTYEYHFWKHQYYDPGAETFARRVYEDVVSMKTIGIDGIIEDGSQRSFFPHGFVFYIYAEALLNRDCDYEKVKEDYFSHIYGENWKEVEAYLAEISELFDFGYMAGEKGEDDTIGIRYSPSRVANLNKIKEVAARGRALAEKNISLPVRVQTVSMRLLYRHAEYCELLAEMMTELALGNKDGARTQWEKFRDDFGRYEYELESYFDHYLALQTFHMILNK